MRARNTKEEALPRGFAFAAASAGLRKHGSGPDVALIVSERPAQGAALFTTNRVKAAPVLLSQKHLRLSRGLVRAILVNAGNANCATGKQGDETARACARAVASLLKTPREQVLLASTGVIGVPLKASAIIEALPGMIRGLTSRGYAEVSRAILTTDTHAKVASRAFLLGGKRATILGMCKGAGMIHPRVATMLAFFLTDAAVERHFLQWAARRAADLSFNRISVDGDTSTNDTLYLLANGVAGNRPLTRTAAGAEQFLTALVEVARELALMMVRDGEGATKVAEIRIEGARTERQAEAIARSIANSPLVKTAIAGADPNWGRILSAIGNAGVEMQQRAISIYINGVRVCEGGAAAAYRESEVQRLMRGKDVCIRVVLGRGRAAVRFWTCDLTQEYIHINASYRT